MVPVSCKLCSDLGNVDTKYCALDNQKTHAQIHTNQLGYISDDGDGMQLKQIFGKCFPSVDFENSEEIDKSRSTLIEICQNIIAAKKKQSNSIKCQICKSKVRYINRKSQAACYLLRHVCYHSTKKPFVCRECKYESAAKSDIASHIKDIHKFDSPVSGVHFEENWLACFDEVSKSLMKSFVRSNLDPSLSTPPREMSIQRRSIFSTILKNANVAKEIRCDHCQAEICATSIGNLEEHIRVHLQQPIFECARCDDTFIHKLGVSLHSVKKHGVPPKGNYIDHSDGHHEAILEWTKKCFAKEKSK